MKSITLTIALLLLATAGGNAWADRRGHGGHKGHGHFGVIIGPYWGPRLYAPFPYYPPYYPPAVIERPAPQVYIEQPAPVAPPAAADAPTNYWYYCAGANSYYPYVKECPDGWQKVVPQPPRQPESNEERQ